MAQNGRRLRGEEGPLLAYVFFDVAVMDGTSFKDAKYENLEFRNIGVGHRQSFPEGLPWPEDILQGPEKAPPGQFFKLNHTFEGKPS